MQNKSSTVIKILVWLATVPFVFGCSGPTSTHVVLENNYSAASGLVVYQAVWQAVSFQAAIPPASASDPQTTISASPNTAYVVLAPGWDPTSSTPPTTFVVLQSQEPGFEVGLNNVLYIPVDDAHFIGNCTSGSTLSQAQTNFITQIVFQGIFAGLSYSAATCTTTPSGGANGS
jgi:hypothetical protein